MTPAVAEPFHGNERTAIGEATAGEAAAAASVFQKLYEFRFVGGNADIAGATFRATSAATG